MNSVIFHKENVKLGITGLTLTEGLQIRKFSKQSPMPVTSV